ncbi:hypothetical protein EUGRSUZ_G03223 [Eucalyptus grandis]|uniref:Uncharacterized protein n=2 Tax=Eucalyptus grandis TaxID=71139 RepID=A0ACC3K914_EUCGR|nr:hypothetical protein EUGRSUZ_G03223 [Eucalyptus grandis]
MTHQRSAKGRDVGPRGRRGGSSVCVNCQKTRHRAMVRIGQDQAPRSLRIHLDRDPLQNLNVSTSVLNNCYLIECDDKLFSGNMVIEKGDRSLSQERKMRRSCLWRQKIFFYVIWCRKKNYKKPEQGDTDLFFLGGRGLNRGYRNGSSLALRANRYQVDHYLWSIRKKNDNL